MHSFAGHPRERMTPIEIEHRPSKPGLCLFAEFLAGRSAFSAIHALYGPEQFLIRTGVDEAYDHQIMSI